MHFYPPTCLKTQEYWKTGIQISTKPIRHWKDITQLQLHRSKNKWKQKEDVSVLVAQEQ